MTDSGLSATSATIPVAEPRKTFRNPMRADGAGPGAARRARDGW